MLLSPPPSVQLFVQQACPRCWPYFNDSFRSVEVSGPVTFTNWWRSRDHNARVGGDPRSQHLYALALDWTGEGGRDLARHLTRLGWTVVDEGDHFHGQLFPRNPFVQ